MSQREFKMTRHAQAAPGINVCNSGILEALYDFLGIVFTTVVADNNLKIRIGLSQARANRSLQRFSAIPRRDDYSIFFHSSNSVKSNEFISLGFIASTELFH